MKFWRDKSQPNKKQNVLNQVWYVVSMQTCWVKEDETEPQHLFKLIRFKQERSQFKAKEEKLIHMIDSTKGLNKIQS